MNSPLLSSKITSDLFSQQILSYLDRKSILEVVKVHSLKTRFVIAQHFCDEHGTQLERVALQKPKDKSHTSETEWVCEDCEGAKLGIIRCDVCEDFDDEAEVVICSTCSKKACYSSPCLRDGGHCDDCEKKFCGYAPCLQVKFCDSQECNCATYCIGCRSFFECVNCNDTYCNQCLVPCSDCNGMICNFCHPGTCFTCNRVPCGRETCQHKVDFCESAKCNYKGYCTNCRSVSECAECNKRYCSQCLVSCSECTEFACSFCLPGICFICDRVECSRETCRRGRSSVIDFCYRCNTTHCRDCRPDGEIYGCKFDS